MLSLMWSEHCAYKHSKKLLRRLPTEGPAVLMGPGENAGVVDVGGGLGVAFKVESHNHPSAVEPFQGAATGVGGILRDVFAVGARPIAVLDSLRFGEPVSVRALALPARPRRRRDRPLRQLDRRADGRRRDLLRGQLRAELPDQRDVPGARAARAADPQRRRRPGNVLVLLGALTGRDGIGGASVLAWAELGEGDEAKRPSVQIGDPFAEKKLLECCLELLDSELLVSLQDLGAAGLTSSSSEMAPRAGSGSTSTCSQVPLREPGMEPFEIMVSESQERMLCVVEPERVDEVLAVCEHWETLATPIGVVTDSGRLRVLRRRQGGGRPAGRDPGRRLPALRPRARAADRAAVPRAAGGAERRRVAGRDAAGATGVGEHRLAPARVRAVRPGRAVADRAPARGGRRRRAGAARPARRSRSRSTATAGGSRAIRGAAPPRPCYECAANLACVGCRAARAHQLPELRQPREAARRLAAGGGGGGDRRRLRGARRPGRGRQRLALQRGARQGRSSRHR